MLIINSKLVKNISFKLKTVLYKTKGGVFIKRLTQNKTNCAFIALLVLNALVWSILATIFKPANGDAIEAYQWSQSFEYGYSKNPYLIGWIFHFIPFNLQSLYAYYATQYFSMIIAIIGIYMLALKILGNKNQALLSAFFSCILTGCLDINVYWNNDNFALQLLWPYLFLAYLNSLESQKYWPLAFCLAGLSLMVKYSTFVFLPCMLLIVFTRDYRYHLKSKYFYIGLCIFFIIVTPNIYWLFNNEFASIKWALRPGAGDSVLSKISSILGVFFPIMLSYPLCRIFGISVNFRKTYSREIKLYFSIFTLPVIVFIVVLSIFNPILNAEWLLPFGFFSLLIAFSIYQPKMEDYRWRNIIIFGFVMLIIKAVSFTVVNM